MSGKRPFAADRRVRDKDENLRTGRVTGFFTRLRISSSAVPRIAIALTAEIS
jgi:hypothetical protein